MKITDIDGDLFADLRQGEMIAHGCNTVGVMGGGVAYEIRRRFPENYGYYRAMCDVDMFSLGRMMYYVENNIGVFNLATQENPGPDATLDAIIGSVTKMDKFISDRTDKPQTVKTVRLGSGIGGLDWADVKPALEAIKSDNELLVYYKEFKK